MAGVMETFISGIVKSAMSEILKKTTGKSTATKRSKRKTRSSTSLTPPASRSRSKRKAGPASGSSDRGAKATRAPKKQVSKRRTSAARSKTRR
ncbi:hypothetical protein [Rhizobium sp. TH2]|uniref:hypothetical protein n=1 Tax=Rhizobium sp. TH2 TaxID=2775403 RepID=UPI002157E5C3|nr:hypothetical protein [Rhizobium sp. TH2]